jgi:hypothetical protein
VSLERGSGLVVLAKFPAQEVPTDATLVVQKVDQSPERSTMMKNFEDPVFGGGLPQVDADLVYRVEYAGKTTRDFKVSVFEHPRLERADAKLRFPEYTGLAEKTIADTRRISAVEGTKLEVEFFLNKVVKKAALVAKDGTEIPLQVEGSRAVAKLADYTVAKSGSYEVKLEDADGRASKVPAQFAIEAKPNRRPDLKFVSPEGDVRVSPLEEVAFRAEAWDDFGVLKFGLQYSVGGNGEPKDVLLRENGKADEKVAAEHLLQLEKLGVAADELISWHLWAEDMGPDGKPRRTSSDMFFAEVRPFEEIFRAGQEGENQQQQRQQTPAGNQATKLAQTQKQVITASWNILRKEAGNTEPGEQSRKDVPVVRESQEQLFEQATELSTMIEDPKSKAFADVVLTEMQHAIRLLKEAETKLPPLQEAVKAEQAAYNALLKLASHEYQVSRRQQSSSQGEQNGGQMQEQLDQLELKAEDKRYETQREAGSPEEQQQKEELAVLNRLKELAQRQQDINEKLKEIQAALQEDKSEKEKEELKRELKRLQEEQQQMLADMDELQEKMEKPENASRLAEERKQLEQTRNEAQQASESMQQGKASEALASGTRAQRDLQEMQSELRKRTSKQFTEEMRNMRSEARELAERQQELAEKLTGAATKPERRTLDGSSEQEKSAQQLGQQQEKLKALTEDMKRVSEAAEVSEPLLSTELYDTLRRAAQADPGKDLDMTRHLAERGYAAEAQKFEQKARGEIEEIKKGVERAAERVLGDEAEALRKARAALDGVTRDLDREITNRTGQSPEDPNGDQENAQGRQPGSQDPKATAQGQGNQPGQGEQNERNTEPGQAPGGEGQTPGESNQRNNRIAQNNRAPGEEPNAEGQQPGRRGSGNQRAQDQGAQQQPGEDGSQNQPGQRGQGQDGEQQGETGGQQPGQSRQMADRQRQNGRQPGGQEGQQPGEGNQPGERQGENGQGEPQPGEQAGQQPGQQGQQGQGQGQGQRGQRTAQNRQPGGQQPGEQPGQEGGEQPGSPSGQQRGQQPGSQPGQQPGQQAGQQAGQGEGQGQPGQRGGRPGQNTADGRSKEPQGNEATGERQEGNQPGSRIAELATAPRERGGIRNNGGGNGGPWGGGAENTEQAGPLTGERFVEWSDQLRMAEEMLDDPKLRAEVSRIREVAKAMRAEFKRHSVEPKWDVVRSQIRAPLAELRNRVTEELARRDKPDSLVPIDRDPVPPRFTEQVRKYYEQLGRSTQE